MRIVRNTGYIKQRKKRARWLAIIGFLTLTGTFWVALNPQYILFAYIILLAGFITFNAGMQQVGKWNRPMRNDQILDARLGKLGDQFALIHYIQLGKSVIEHLLVYPGGVLVITAKEVPGTVSVKGRRWKKRGIGLRRLFSFSGPQLGNPSWETDQTINKVERHLTDQSFQVDVSGVIVFTDPRADVEAEEPDYPILMNDEIPLYVQDLPADSSLTNADRQRLIELLSIGDELETNAPKARRSPVKRRAA